ncbi:50S ribosomal protein L24 [Buchnera aphidicola (Hormaphis cornu)]|nr:50S ribosomal protein L24 [Buchnera aphidicola (Hormaphis cornu)]
MALKIRSNDSVIVIAGKYKGKKGVVKKVLNYNKIIVEGINIVKKHQKPIPSQNKTGGVYQKEAPIHVSNVMIFNQYTGKADRVGFRFQEGKKVRFFKSNNKTVN